VHKRDGRDREQRLRRHGLPLPRPSPEGITTGYFNFDNLQDVAVASLNSNWLDIGASDGFGGLQDIPGTFPTGLCPRGVSRPT